MTLKDDSASKLELESRYAEENKKIQKVLVGPFSSDVFLSLFSRNKSIEETSRFIISYLHYFS